MPFIINNTCVLNDLSTATAVEYPNVIAGYVVTTYGEIVNRYHPETDIPMSPVYHSTNGYDFVLLMKTDGSFQLFPLDEIVAISFIHKPVNANSVQHVDNDKRNNTVVNLKWITEEETWVSVNDFSENIRPCYSVSNFGRVRNDNTGVILRQLTRNGYLSVGVMKNCFQVNVHRLVAYAFYGIPQNSDCVVNHIDCDRHNNHVKNLEWVSQYSNNEHAILVGVGYTMKRGEDNILAKITEVEARAISQSLLETCRNSRVTYESLIDRYPNITLDIVRDINRKRTWRWVSNDYF